MSITGSEWKYYNRHLSTDFDFLRKRRRKPSHVYPEDFLDFKYHLIPRDELPSTVIHIVGSKKEPRGEELSRIVSDTIYKLHRRAFTYKPDWW